MFEFLIRVKRVSHVNRVSSYNELTKNIRVFFAVSFLVFLFANCACASDITAQKVIELANADRKERGILELAENAKLSEAAAQKAEDMISGNYFSHTSPSGTTPWRWIEKEKYDYNYAGENLAMDFTSSEKMNEAWLESPTHRANILNEKYKDIGVATKTGVINGHETTVVVQMFGSGDKSAPAENGMRETKNKNRPREENDGFVPELPVGEKNVELANSFLNAPVITSPQKDESLSGNELEIFGRAKPGSVIRLYDSGELVADSLSDKEGWFRTKISNLRDGNHVLKLESETVIGRRKEVRFSDAEVGFSIDTEKPRITYRLFQNISPDRVLVGIASSKPNCILDVGGERIYSSSRQTAFVSVRKDKLSVPLAARDRAGNKTYGGINFSSYYFPVENFDIAKVIAAAMVPRDVFAAESGREAVRNNLGLAPHQFLASKK